jgi:SAM-dependent methyltransferase
MVNTYSPIWFDLFLETQPYPQAEVAFVERFLPNPPYAYVLDVACGPARHARLLAELGYEVTGIDIHEQALATARQITNGSALFLHQDMRHLANLPATFDGIISMWQSFGYFDAETNRDILRQMAAKLNSPGRLILDLYHRAYFENNQGTRQIERRGILVTVTDTMQGNRLTAEIDYGEPIGRETFSWQLYTPDELSTMAAELGLHSILACTEFNEQHPAGPDKPRMQLVLEKD